MASYESERQAEELKEDLEMLAAYLMEKEEEIERERKEHTQTLEQLETLLTNKDEELTKWRLLNPQGLPPDPPESAVDLGLPEEASSTNGKAWISLKEELADINAYNKELEEMVEIMERENKQLENEKVSAETETSNLSTQLLEVSEKLEELEDQVADMMAERQELLGLIKNKKLGTPLSKGIQTLHLSRSSSAFGFGSPRKNIDKIPSPPPPAEVMDLIGINVSLQGTPSPPPKKDKENTANEVKLKQLDRKLLTDSDASISDCKVSKQHKPVRRRSRLASRSTAAGDDADDEASTGSKGEDQEREEEEEEGPSREEYEELLAELREENRKFLKELRAEKRGKKKAEKIAEKAQQEVSRLKELRSKDQEIIDDLKDIVKTKTNGRHLSYQEVEVKVGGARRPNLISAFLSQRPTKEASIFPVCEEKRDVHEESHC